MINRIYFENRKLRQLTPDGPGYLWAVESYGKGHFVTNLGPYLGREEVSSTMTDVDTVDINLTFTIHAPDMATAQLVALRLEDAIGYLP